METKLVLSVLSKAEEKKKERKIQLIGHWTSKRGKILRSQNIKKSETDKNTQASFIKIKSLSDKLDCTFSRI